ncbi:hypothetical protein [Nostoc sp.]
MPNFLIFQEVYFPILNLIPLAKDDNGVAASPVSDRVQHYRTV